MTGRAKVQRHGDNHGVGGSDRFPVGVDATENVGDIAGVHSIDPSTGPQGGGLVLTSTPDGGSLWGPATAASETFPTGVSDLGATKSLLGWWRLGDGPGTFLDSNPYLTAVDQVQQVTGAALTAHVAGGLASGQDDGAVEFNGHGNTVIGGTAGDYLSVSSSRFHFTAIGSVYTVGCWVNPKSNVATFFGGVIGTMSPGFSNETGWFLTINWTSGQVTWGRRLDGSAAKQVTGTVAFDAWSFIVGTYDGSQFQLYINGLLVGTTVASTSIGAGDLQFGRYTSYSPGGGAGFDYLYGFLDEVTIWGSVLSPADINRLYADSAAPGADNPVVYVNGA